MPIPSVTGWDMPAGAANVVNQALRRMVAREVVDYPWQALEMWAADYLAGPDAPASPPTPPPPAETE